MTGIMKYGRKVRVRKQVGNAGAWRLEELIGTSAALSGHNVSLIKLKDGSYGVSSRVRGRYIDK